MSVSSVSSSEYVSNTNSGSFTIDGLGDGTDWTELIDATLEAEKYELTQYKEDLEDAESAVTLLTALDEEILELSTTLQSMDEMDEFMTYSGTVTGDGEVSVSVEDGAEEGTYNLVVNQLAQKDVWVAEDFDLSSTSEVLTNSNATITISYAGEDMDINIPAGTTAQEFVDLINANNDLDDKVSASLVYDGENYHVKFSGEDTGEDNAVTVNMNLSGDAGTLTGASFTNTLTAQNAQIKIDGYPSGADEWLERDSNSVDDVIDNMTLALSSTTDEDGLTISVSYDTDTMIEKIESFVSEVNQIIYDIQDLTGELDDGEDDEDQFYLKDSTIDLVLDSIKDVLSTIGVGFMYYDSSTDSGDEYPSLSTIGITTDSTEGSSTFGQLEIDYDELEDALAEDPEAVGMLFAANGEAESSNSSVEVLSTIAGLTGGGEFDIQYTVSGGVITSATVDGNEMLISGNTLLAQSDSEANGLYLEVTDLTDGSYSSTVTIKQGKCGELADLCSAITDVETGSIPLLLESYENLTNTLEGNIYNEEERLDNLESSLTRRYAALDEMLSYYSGLETQLETTLAQFE